MASDSSSANSIQCLPPEAISCILPELRPRSLRRFGLTCRMYLALGERQRITAHYGRLLVPSALRRVAAAIAGKHSHCQISSRASLQAQAARFAEASIAAQLSESTEPPGRWGYEALLKFLYPIVAAMPTDWALAPYTLEWCAENEWRLRQPTAPHEGQKPQRDVLSLLHDDVLARLAVCAKDLGWASGVAYLDLVQTVSALATEESHPMISSALCAARVHLTPVSPVSIAVAIEAATLHLCAKGSPRAVVARSPAWMNLGKVRSAKQLAWKTYSWTGGPGAPSTPKAYNWVSLLGIKPGSDRSPWRLVERFSCAPEADMPEMTAQQYARTFANTMYGLLGPLGFLRFVRHRPPEMLVALAMSPEDGGVTLEGEAERAPNEGDEDDEGDEGDEDDEDDERALPKGLPAISL